MKYMFIKGSYQKHIMSKKIKIHRYVVSSRNILISCEYEQIYHANVCALITFERKEENNAQSYGSTL